MELGEAQMNPWGAPPLHFNLNPHFLVQINVNPHFLVQINVNPHFLEISKIFRTWRAPFVGAD